MPQTWSHLRAQLASLEPRSTDYFRLSKHLPTGWPWQTAWTDLFTRVCGPPGTAMS